MKIIRTNLTDKKEQYNAMVSSNTTLDELKGNVIEVTGYIIYEKDSDEKEGEILRVTTFKLKDGTFAGGVSPVVSKAVESYLEVFGEIGEENPAVFKIITDKSKGGRDFLNLMIM